MVIKTPTEQEKRLRARLSQEIRISRSDVQGFVQAPGSTCKVSCKDSGPDVGLSRHGDGLIGDFVHWWPEGGQRLDGSAFDLLSE